MSGWKAFFRERFGGPYRLAQRSFWGARRTLESTRLGSRVNDVLWRFRDLWDRGMAEGYIRSAAHPHRRLLAEVIERVLDDVGERATERAGEDPREDQRASLLEIGCNAGPNLRVLAERFPSLRLEGFDINRRAIETGRRWLASEGVEARLSTGDLSRLASYTADSFDIVLADAVFMYVGPDRIEDAIREALRVARHALVIVDFQDASARPEGSYSDGKWRRDYRALLTRVDPAITLDATSIPSEIWGGEWAEFGEILAARKAAKRERGG